MAKKYADLRKRVREWRLQEMSLTEICKRTSLSKGTIYYWIKDLPRPESTKTVPLDKRQKSLKKARAANTAKHKAKREKAYKDAAKTMHIDLKDQSLRDFVVTYLGEGYRRSRHTVAVSNSNPAIIKLSYKHLKKFSKRPIGFALQYHKDNDPQKLKEFWGEQLGIDPELIKLQRKSNSGNLAGRKWRSIHGVLTVRTHDTYFRCKVQAWMDYVQKQWND
jgi:hypothetical protein